MRKLIVLVVCGLAWPLSALADEPKEEGKGAVVKEIDLKGLKRVPPSRKVEPTVITSEEELVKAFPEKELQGRIKKEGDFKKQQLLFFAWVGAGDDQFSYKVEEGKRGPEITFSYMSGVNKDIAYYFHLYAIPKDATWRVGK